MAEPTTIAIMAKAPIAGFAKTRLNPALGAAGAAALAARLIERTVASACSAMIGPVTLWVTPNEKHPLFRSLRTKVGVTLACQPEGDLGHRMLTAITVAGGPALVIGCDCPGLGVAHLRAAAEVLRTHDAALAPAEDGGYALIGLRRPEPSLFTGMTWSTASVMQETRQRLRENHLSWRELETLWDVDTPTDLVKLERAYPGLLN
jgi:rSAM/selenodomain-associated transferase 1